MSNIIKVEYPYKFFTDKYFTLQEAEHLLWEAYKISYLKYSEEGFPGYADVFSPIDIVNTNTSILIAGSIPYAFFESVPFQNTIFTDGHFLDQLAKSIVTGMIESREGDDFDKMEELSAMSDLFSEQNGNLMSLDENKKRVMQEDVKIFLRRQRLFHYDGESVVSALMRGADPNDRFANIPTKEVW